MTGPRGDRARGPRRYGLSPYARYAIQRLILFPAQLLLVLLILYVALFVPGAAASGQNLGLTGFWTGLAQMIGNDFTGNWGVSVQNGGVPVAQLYAWAIPQSIQLAIFSLGIAAAIAYPASLLAGWTRRTSVDVAVRATSLLGTFFPVIIVGGAATGALFYWFLATYHDIPTGLLPNSFWWLDQGYTLPPSWILFTQAYTQPTGFPLIDGALHGAWGFEQIVLLKTLIQGGIIAVVYVSIFLRHSFTVVRDASQELHVTAARSRGVADRTLLWRHTAHRVRPTFLLLFALTLPAYLGTQFVIEAVFQDYGLGTLVLLTLTGQIPARQTLAPILESWQVMMFLLAIAVLVWLVAVDLVARRLDPRPVSGK
ncbi:MAG TPA: ABC transporter permease subunit [Thermoplasmata archaeon]|nr:ABC transporter permease subunit [Thermoplasmata archaeon]